jgi:hypothetical protein
MGASHWLPKNFPDMTHVRGYRNSPSTEATNPPPLVVWPFNIPPKPLHTIPTPLSCIPFYSFLSHIVSISSQQLRLLVTANAVSSLLILFSLMMEAIHSSETSVLTRVTWCHIPEDSVLHSHRHEIVKSYKY